jgi:cephalosporin hydroxylase
MDPIKQFEQECSEKIKTYKTNKALTDSSKFFMKESTISKYCYNFKWMGRPIIQYPQDIIAMQEIIWDIKPDLIIETGVAHGGSIIFYASLLELLQNDGIVIGIDIEIRPHNRSEIENHPMFKKIKLIEGSSISSEVINKVNEFVKGKKKILVALDSMHTHDHVIKELELYSKYVTKDSYLIVFDTIVEDFPKNFYSDRPWDVGNNPKTAVREFLKKNDDFIIDEEIQNKLLITVNPDGYLKRIK